MTNPDPARMVGVYSPNKPRPAQPDVRFAADTLRIIEVNYQREGSGPGSRFEGRLLEDIQAETVLRLISRKLLDMPPQICLKLIRELATGEME